MTEEKKGTPKKLQRLLGGLRQNAERAKEGAERWERRREAPEDAREQEPAPRRLPRGFGFRRRTQLVD